MGEVASVPVASDDALVYGSAASAENGSSPIPDEGALLSQLIQLLSQRPRHSLLLSDLGGLLPEQLRQQVKDHGGLCTRLQQYPTMFSISGQPGKESVSLRGGAGSDQPSKLSPNAAEFTPSSPGGANSPGGEARASGAFDEEVDGHSAVQLRGLPYRATIEEVRSFLGGHTEHLADEASIHLVLNRDGRPSGFARVQFESPEKAKACRDELHLRAMEDRYVEVFLYNERPSKGRQRRGLHEEGIAALGAGDPGWNSASLENVPSATKEEVLNECRAEMADVKKRKLLLSMLGVALSAGARAHLKQMDQGLKHFLAQYPQEFSVEGGKGCEYVMYSPANISLSEAIGGGSPYAASDDVIGLGGDGLLSSPKPAESPSLNHPTPGARGLMTPSDWGTPAPGAAPWASQAAAASTWLPPWPPTAGDVSADPAASWGGAPPWPMPPPNQMWPGWPGAGVGGYPGWPGDDSSAFAGFNPFVPPPGDLPAQLAPGAPVQKQPQQGQTKTAPTNGNKDGGLENLSAAVRLRGLPFSATEQDVLAFFGQHDVVDRIADGPKAVSLLLRSNGRPSGQGVVQMRDRADAELAQKVLSGQWMGSRYIEVFLYGEDGGEGGSPTKSGNTPPAKGSDGAAQPPRSQPALADVLGLSGMDPHHPGAMPPANPWGWGGPAPGGHDSVETSWESLFHFLTPESAAAATAAYAAGLGADGQGAPRSGKPAPTMANV